VEDGEAPTDGPASANEADAVNPCGACQPPKLCLEGACVEPAPGGCTPESTQGCASETATLTCDPSGQAYVPKACLSNHTCKEGVCVPHPCEPATWFCEGLAGKKQCNPEGTGFLPMEKCPDGQYCTSGSCAIKCEIDPKFGAYVGCAFWTVDLPNYPDFTLSPTPEDLPHAVVLSNPNQLDAEVTFESPPGIVVNLPSKLIPAGKAVIFEMPVVNVQATGVMLAGIRFTTTRPVLAHQFNPLDNKFSNDASLLLPEPFVGSDYVILTWPTAPIGLVSIPGFPAPPSQNGYFTVLAIYDATEVTFQVTANIQAGPKVTAMKAGGVQTVTLQKAEVLNVEAEPTTLFDPLDLTGSTVSASKPVMVFAGHEEAVISDPALSGQDNCCADHLEEQMFPLSVLGTEYLCVHSPPRGTEPDLWRIQAAEGSVTLTTVPPLGGVNGVSLGKKGDWIEVYTNQSFELVATGKVQVAQYLVSQQHTQDFIGDPSQILAVPRERFRESYVFMVPPGYQKNYATLIKQQATTVTLDGAPLNASYKAFGGATWQVAYVELQDGVHRIAGDAPIGLVATGYNVAVSYGYPGGLAD
jgi:hypothetical protein